MLRTQLHVQGAFWRAAGHSWLGGSNIRTQDTVTVLVPTCHVGLFPLIRCSHPACSKAAIVQIRPSESAVQEAELHLAAGMLRRRSDPRGSNCRRRRRRGLVSAAGLRCSCWCTGGAAADGPRLAWWGVGTLGSEDCTERTGWRDPRHGSSGRQPVQGDWTTGISSPSRAVEV